MAEILCASQKKKSGVTLSPVIRRLYGPGPDPYPAHEGEFYQRAEPKKWKTNNIAGQFRPTKQTKF